MKSCRFSENPKSSRLERFLFESLIKFGCPEHKKGRFVGSLMLKHCTFQPYFTGPRCSHQRNLVKEALLYLDFVGFSDHLRRYKKLSLMTFFGEKN